MREKSVKVILQYTPWRLRKVNEMLKVVRKGIENKKKPKILKNHYAAVQIYYVASSQTLFEILPPFLHLNVKICIAAK